MTKSRKLIITAYVFTLLAILGYAIALGAPYWTHFLGSSYGIVSYCHEDDCRLKRHVFDHPRSFMIPGIYTLGLTSCFAAAIISTLLVCGYKSKGYKFCFASGALGLLSVTAVLATIIIISIEAEIGKPRGHGLGWTFLLAILSTAFALVATVLFLVAGYKQKRSH